MIDILTDPYYLTIEIHEINALRLPCPPGKLGIGDKIENYNPIYHNTIIPVVKWQPQIHY